MTHCFIWNDLQLKKYCQIGFVLLLEGSDVVQSVLVGSRATETSSHIAVKAWRRRGCWGGNDKWSAVFVCWCSVFNVEINGFFFKNTHFLRDSCFRDFSTLDPALIAIHRHFPPLDTSVSVYLLWFSQQLNQVQIVFFKKKHICHSL